MAAAIRTSKLLAKLRRAPGEEVDAQDLVRRHFLMQEERPSCIQEAQIRRLDPFLRSLLFTDGTVTRALAAQTLAPVTVSRLGQAEVRVPNEVARYLEADFEEISIRRRVSIAVGAAAPPTLWAESYILPDRLPLGFLGLLDGAPDGIGQSLQRIALESYRELLWFGFDTTPGWAAASPASRKRTVRRLYRIVSDSHASILISENFATEQRAGVYHLAGLGEPATSPEEQR